MTERKSFRRIPRPETKAEVKASEPISDVDPSSEAKASSSEFKPFIKVQLDVDTLKMLREKAIHQEILHRMRKVAAATAKFEDLLEDDSERFKLTKQHTVAYDDLLGVLDQYKKLEAIKVKKTSRYFAVTVNPDPEKLQYILEDGGDPTDEIPEFHCKIANIIKTKHVQKIVWGLESDKKGRVHAHILVEFTQEFAQSTVKQRFVKRFMDFIGNPMHVCVKVAPRPEGWVKYFADQAFKVANDPEQKGAAEETALLRKEYRMKDKYELTAGCDDKDIAATYFDTS